MILATNHGPAIIRAKLVDFCGRVFLKALGDLEVGGMFNKNLKKQNHSFWFDRPRLRREHLVPPTLLPTLLHTNPDYNQNFKMEED